MTSNNLRLAAGNLSVIQEIAHGFKHGKYKSVALLTGAGISTPSGIPDFRSPGGMYDTLRPELLTASPSQRQAMAADPVTVVSWELFRVNPLPYMEVRRPFILGVIPPEQADTTGNSQSKVQKQEQEPRWRMTIAHAFVRLLHDHNLLHNLFTCNIDGLDYQSGVPHEKIISVHGTLGIIKCEFCGSEQDPQEFRDKVARQIKDIYKTDDNAPTESIPIRCTNTSCGKDGVKPATVLYGRALPEYYFHAQNDLNNGNDQVPPCDLLLVAGTSLTVYPSAGLPGFVSSNTRRIVINKDIIYTEDINKYNNVDDSTGDIIIPPVEERDSFLKGDSDAIFLQLIIHCGWSDKLYEMKDALCTNSKNLIEEMKTMQEQGLY